MNDIIRQISEQLPSFLKRNIIFLALFFTGILFIIVGIFQQTSPNEEISLEKAVDSEEATAQSIYVDVGGAVMAPGLYKLDDGSRIQDVLVMAGGFSSDADREYIAQYLNLAQRLTDGAKLFIPKENMNSQKSVAGINTSVATIDINSASSSELDALPAIGMVTAEKIISNRPYTDIGELVSKKVMGQKTFDKVKDMISVY